MLKARTLVIVLAIMGTGAQVRAGGDELSLSISADAKEVYLAEPLRICVQVTNVSDHDVQVPILWTTRYFSGTITRQGKSSTWSLFPPGFSIARVRVITLRPGESYQRFTELLRIPYCQRPGTYVLDGKFESDGSAPNYITRKSVPCWKGSISAKPLKIEVKKPPRKEDVEALKILCAPYGGVEKIGSFENIWLVGLHSQKMYEGKDRRYQTVLEKYPNSVYAPYCRFSMALYHLDWCRDGLGDDYKKGVEYLDVLLKMRPAFRLADRAELTLAQLHLAEAKLSRTATPLEREALREKAKAHLKHILLKYPKRPSAREAKEMMGLIAKKIKQAQKVRRARLESKYPELLKFYEQLWPKWRKSPEGRKKALKWIQDNRKYWEDSPAAQEIERLEKRLGIKGVKGD